MPVTPPTKSVTPDKLKPFVAHGVNFLSEAGDEAIAECPFCGKEKFYVNTSTGVWSCKVCQTGTKKGGGNVYTFLRKLWELSKCPSSEAGRLKDDRKLLRASTLEAWGCRVSAQSGEWVVPGYSFDWKLNNLYRYVRGRLLATEGLSHALHGVNLFDPKRENVYLCEGPWDGMALWEVLKSSKVSESGEYGSTANPAASLLANANVLAVPGCNSFQESWLPLFKDKIVTLLYDSDHPKPPTQVVPAGFAGMKRVAGLLSGTAKEIRYLDWGTDGFDHSRKSGYDIRDQLCESPSLSGRIASLKLLLSQIKPVPEDWKTGGPSSVVHEAVIDQIKCESWVVLLNQWKRALRWTPGLEGALAVMLATVISTRAVGDQLWFMVVSPPSSGKTTLGEGLAVDKQYVFSKDTFNGFHSGYDIGTGEDHSPILNMFDKTFIIKDADTLLTNDNREGVLAELRAVWDRSFRASKKIKNKSNDYFGNMTVLLLGTSKLRMLDASESGARFLTYSIMDEIDTDLEDEILLRVINNAVSSLAFESNGSMSSQYDPEKLKAMQMTGGYVHYLRENANELLSSVSFGEEEKTACVKYGKFVAYLRGRPSKQQDEVQDREFAARLVSQFGRLAGCVAAVTQKHSVDFSVMKLVKQVALDTAKGKTLDMMRWLRTKNKGLGLDPRGLTAYLGDDIRKVQPLLNYLAKINAVEIWKEALPYGIESDPKYRLTPRMKALYDFSMGGK